MNEEKPPHEGFTGWTCPIENCGYSLNGSIEIIMLDVIAHWDKYHAYEENEYSID